MARDRQLPRRWVRSCLGGTLAILAASAVGPRFDRVHRPLSVPHRERVLLPQRRFVPGSHKRARKELPCGKNRKGRREFRPPKAAVTCETTRNTCAAGRKKGIRLSFGPLI